MKKKVHFVTGSLAGGGAERVLILLAGGLQDKRYNVSIISFSDPDEYSYDKRINRIRLHHGKIINHTISRFLQLLKYYRKKNNRPDIIISFLPPVSFVTILIAKIYNIKIIVSEHINHLQIGTKRDRFTRKYLYRFADITTVLTKFDVPYYKKYRAQVYVMPNPCSFEIQTDLNYERENSIIAIGNLDRFHHKGFDNLISLISPILKKNPTWNLKIIGSGEQGMELLRNLVNKNQIGNQVTFTGFRKDIKEIMKISEIFILPSRFEGLPMVLIEAISQGMICLAYDCKTGPSDIIISGKNGILVEDQNIIQMQNELEKLIHNKELRNTIRTNTIKSIGRFSIDNIICQWELLISKIV